MTITPSPDQERMIEEALHAGLIARAEEALDVGLERLRDRLAQRQAAQSKKNLVEVFAPLRGLNLEFSRNLSTGRPVEL